MSRCGQGGKIERQKKIVASKFKIAIVAPIDRTRVIHVFEKYAQGNACIPKSSALADSRETVGDVAA